MSSDEQVEKAQSPKKVHLDTILIEELGQFGRFQQITLALLAIPIIFTGFAQGEYVFTTARTASRCHINECDGVDPEFAPPWKEYAIPKLQSGAFDQCSRFGSNSSQWAPDGTCPASLFDTSTVESCQTYVYENDISIVKEFDLACDEWRRSQIGSFRPIGILVMLPVMGYISDRWGRRVVVITTAFNTGFIGLARSFVNSYEWFTILQVLEAAAGAGTFSSTYILMTELVGPRYRVMAGAMCSTLFASGQVLLSFVAWLVPRWRQLTLALYIPQVFIILYFWILTESIRWLISKGRYEEAEKILKKVAKTNKKELSEKSLSALRQSTEAERKTEKPKEPWLIYLVFNSPVILKRCFITPVWWISMTLIYYGLGINAVNLSGNPYLNYALVCAIEIPGFWTAIFLLDRVGRKLVIIAGFWICAACQFTFAFMPESMDGLSLAIYLIGKYSISPVVTSLYIYTGELYPTKYRHNLLAFSSMIGRIGSIVAPLTPSLAQEVWEPFPSVLFGSFALLSGFLVFFTPETLGIKLPDTFEDAEALEKKRKS